MDDHPRESGTELGLQAASSVLDSRRHRLVVSRPHNRHHGDLPAVTHEVIRMRRLYPLLGTTILCLGLTAPVAAHLIGRAAYYSGIRLWKKTWIDQLKDRYHSGQTKR